MLGSSLFTESSCLRLAIWPVAFVVYMVYHATMEGNDTGEWIFSDEAHAWMNNDVRGPEWPDTNCQVAVIPFTGDVRPGWEYGLFGFKTDVGLMASYVFYADDMDDETKVTL